MAMQENEALPQIVSKEYLSLQEKNTVSVYKLFVLLNSKYSEPVPRKTGDRSAWVQRMISSAGRWIKK